MVNLLIKLLKLVYIVILCVDRVDIIQCLHTCAELTPHQLRKLVSRKYHRGPCHSHKYSPDLSAPDA